MENLINDIIETDENNIKADLIIQMLIDLHLVKADKIQRLKNYISFLTTKIYNDCTELDKLKAYLVECEKESK